MEFLKDYGSLIISAIGAFFVLLWKIFRVVNQSEMLNERMKHLEEQFEKLDAKLDRVLECPKA